MKNIDMNRPRGISEETPPHLDSSIITGPKNSPHLSSFRGDKNFDSVEGLFNINAMSNSNRPGFGRGVPDLSNLSGADYEAIH